MNGKNLRRCTKDVCRSFAGLLIFLLFVTLVLTGCPHSADKGNNAGTDNSKPVVFFNRAPRITEGGDIDMSIMNRNNKTFYIGYDA